MRPRPPRLCVTQSIDTMNLRKFIYVFIVFIAMLGCIRLAHELSGSTEDGNLPVNAVAAAILTAAICGIYHRIIKYIIKNRTK